MRGFPGSDDDITHEILLATDGCRTSTRYYLRKGIKTIEKRGIKVRHRHTSTLKLTDTLLISTFGVI